MSDEQTVDKHCEFEVKFRVEASIMMQFKQLVTATFPDVDFVYVQGVDDYFIKPETELFKRYRHADYPKGSKKEITTKTKPVGAKNNIQRRELNLDVTNADPEVVRLMIEDDGYAYSFSIYKSCQIYRTSDATLVFYSVVETTPNVKPKEEAHFIEIEIDEDIVSILTQDEAWAIIERYEKLLAPLGITAQKRIRKSLFETYRR